MNIGKLGAVALVASVLAVTPALAKHHSNTFSKIGHAIQYTTNKAAQNLSVNTHRAINHKSVMHRRNGNRTHKAVITPGGHIYRIHHKYHHH
jgi:hypothetical protein